MNSFMKAQSHVDNEFLSNLFEKKKNKELEEVLIPICSSAFKGYLADFLSSSIHPLPGLKKKNWRKKNSLLLLKWNFKLKKLYPEKNILILQETETPKNFLTFSQTKDFLYISGNRNRKNVLYIRKRIFLMFQERRYLELWPSEFFLLLQEKNI